MSRHSALNEAHLRRLLDVGRELAGELDLERVLGRALDVARELTGARYAALGVLDERRAELEQFLTRGIDEEMVAEIGEPGHPPMRTFLGVPLLVRGRSWGNLYLTEKDAGEFTEADQQTAEILADWISTAINNAQLYHGIERQRDDLRQANRALEAATAIARAVGGETELTPILAKIAERGRLLVEAESIMLLLADEDGGELRPAASGQVPVSVPIAGTPAGQVFRRRRPLRVEHLDPHSLLTSDEASHPGAMMVPLIHRGDCLGALVAIDGPQRPLTPGRDEEPVLLSIAASAATAVGTARSVAESRVRHSVEAAERERARWARELHDDTLQNLAGLRMMLSGASRAAASESVSEMLIESLGRVDETIAEMRRLIADLRPATLDELGIEAALSALVERVRVGSAAIEVELLVDLGPGGPDIRLPPEIEITVYRLVQEALSNVVAHAGATRARVELAADEDTVGLRIGDDGRGFDPSWRRSGAGSGHGFGLPGMRERVALLRGWLEIDSGPDRGTTLTAILPRPGRG